MFSGLLMGFKILVMKEICFGGSGNRIFESIAQRWQQLGEETPAKNWVHLYCIRLQHAEIPMLVSKSCMVTLTK